MRLPERKEFYAGRCYSKAVPERRIGAMYPLSQLFALACKMVTAAEDECFEEFALGYRVAATTVIAIELVRTEGKAIGAYRGRLIGHS